MDDAVQCRQLVKRFDRLAAVDGVSLSVKSGEVFGLIGPDGAGKTTLIRLLCGILPPTAGEAAVLGSDIRRISDAHRSKIGYMPQRFSLYGELTVDENITFFADLHSVPTGQRPEKAHELLYASRLLPFRTRRVQDLSGGMKQKLSLVCTLLHTPRLLFLDEPTTGVDPVSRSEFWEILYGLVDEGLTLIVSTPYMEEAERCDRIALLHRGHVLSCDTPLAVRERAPGMLLELKTRDPWKVRNSLKDLPFVRSVEVFGDRLHVMCEENIEDKVLLTALSSRGIDCESARSIIPGLEDAFIYLLGDGGL